MEEEGGEEKGVLRSVAGASAYCPLSTADLEEDDAREDDDCIPRDGQQLEHHDVGPLDDHEGARVDQEAWR